MKDMNPYEEHEGYAEAVSWIKKWLFTTDHKDVGMLYFVTALWYLLVGGLLAMIFRTQLAYPGMTLLTGSTYNQAVSIHGLIMVLFFLTPLGLAFANYFIPLQIGARDVAFPRFNAFSYWMYAFGGLLLLSGFFVPGGAGAAGWTNYAPLNSLQFTPGGGESLTGLGLLMDWISLTMGTVNLIATVLVMRAPGMTWEKIPMFTWFLLLTQVLLIFSVPSIFAGTLMLIADRTLGTLYFLNPGGSSILWDHMWWWFGHPEVYVVLLPALGAIAEIVQAFSGRPFYAKRVVIFAVALGMIPFSYSIYGHHMFLTGINLTEREFFTINTEINTIPSGLIVVCTILTLIGGSIKFRTPMLFALGGLALFIIGGITGVFDSSVFLDQQLRGTFQVVSHFHYIMPGAGIFGLFGAIYYYLPRWTGRMYNEALGKLHFLLSFIFFNMIFFPMNYLLDMPRRVFTYLPQVDPLYVATNGAIGFNTIETIGAWAFGLMQVLLVYQLLWTWRRGRYVGYNPWNLATPEWTGDVRSYIENYPRVYSMKPLVAADGAAQATLPLHGNPGTPLSSRPFLISLGSFLSFLGLGTVNTLLGLPLFFLGLLFALWGLLGWAYDDFGDRFRLHEEDEDPHEWPLTRPQGVSPSAWRLRVGVWLFLASDVLLFTAVAASYLFIRLNVPVWPPPGSVHNVWLGAANAIALLTSGLTMLLAYLSIRQGDRRGFVGFLLGTLLLALSSIGLTIGEWLQLASRSVPFTPSSGLPGTTFYFMSSMALGHVIAGSCIIIYFLAKGSRGAYGPDNHLTIDLFSLFWGFVVTVGVALFPLLYLL
jgi:cytochrome c oxidase subunit I+III